MVGEAIRVILIPFLGTALGATCVIFMKETFNMSLQRVSTGLATSARFFSATVFSVHPLNGRKWGIPRRFSCTRWTCHNPRCR